MTSAEARKHVFQPGYWLVNVAPVGEAPDWREEVEHPSQSALLFGYPAAEFMAKQSKGKK